MSPRRRLRRRRLPLPGPGSPQRSCPSRAARRAAPRSCRGKAQAVRSEICAGRSRAQRSTQRRLQSHVRYSVPKSLQGMVSRGTRRAGRPPAPRPSAGLPPGAEIPGHRLTRLSGRGARQKHRAGGWRRCFRTCSCGTGEKDGTEVAGELLGEGTLPGPLMCLHAPSLSGDGDRAGQGVPREPLTVGGGWGGPGRRWHSGSRCGCWRGPCEVSGGAIRAGDAPLSPLLSPGQPRGVRGAAPALTAASARGGRGRRLAGLC